MKIWKVTHRLNTVESVFLVSADSASDAKKQVRAERDLLGSMSAVEASFESSYRLYSIDTTTGSMIATGGVL